MEKRAFLAVILSLLVLILYQQWVAWEYGEAPEAPEAPVERPPADYSVPPSPPVAPAEIRAEPVVPEKSIRQIRVETDRYVAVFTNQGARLKSFLLKGYRTTVSKESPPVEMISSAPGASLPLGVEFGGQAPFNDESLVYSTEARNLTLTGHTEGTLQFRAQALGGFVVTKRFKFWGNQYPFEMEVAVEGNGPKGPLGLTFSSPAMGPTPDAAFEGLLALVEDKLVQKSGEELTDGNPLKGQISWAGFGYTYFLSALLPRGDSAREAVVAEKGGPLTLAIRGAESNGGDAKRSYMLFLGPKDLDVLNAVGMGLERSINFGYFSFVALPLLHVLRFSHRFTGSYGVDIILLTFIIKILLAPLTHKSYVSMKQMQKLQPQMERIKERYKNDRERLNKEIMELYRRNKVNPLGGCLPMVLQIPVFIGLYNALLTPIELRHASFLWVRDLSQPDWKSLPFKLPGWLGGEFGFPVLTLLMGASMFVQQWMTPTAGDPNQRKIMMMMPLFFTVLFVTFPAGLTIYWLANNILTIGQQYLTNRMTR